jgi:hypothetical protein
MALATRLEQLGTETAFAVSLAAAEWGAKGNRIFPFHLGDLNIATPKNVVEAQTARPGIAQPLASRSCARHSPMTSVRVVDCRSLPQTSSCNLVASR